MTQHGGHHQGHDGPEPGSSATAEQDMEHSAGAGQGKHSGGHEGGHDKHAGHDPEAFRRLFWLSLVLTVPTVAFSQMVQDWFGYSLDAVQPGYAKPLRCRRGGQR